MLGEAYNTDIVARLRQNIWTTLADLILLNGDCLMRRELEFYSYEQQFLMQAVEFPNRTV